MSDDIGDDDPISLALAAKLFFHGTLTKSSLRTEARKGNLEIIRIANKDFVTKNAIRQMIDRCRVPAQAKPEKQQSPAPLGITAQQAARVRLAAAKSAAPPKNGSIPEADRIREKLFLDSLTTRKRPKRGR